MDFGQKMVRMPLCQLLALRYKVMSIPIENHFDGDLNKHGFEVLLLCNKEHLFVLNTYEILGLKQFVEQSFMMLGLSVSTETAPV